MKRNKLLARLIALNGVRNTLLEDLHFGEFPISKTGDFTDVKVVTPTQVIEWNNLSRISDKEIRELMLEVEDKIFKILKTIPNLEKQAGSESEFLKELKVVLFDRPAASWDLSEEQLVMLHGKDYKSKLNDTPPPILPKNKKRR